MSPTARTDVLLIGGGVASVRCARALRRGGFDGSILLIGDERNLPYNRPPLSKELMRGEVSDDLVLAEPDAWYARRDVDVRAGTRMVGLDPQRRVATLDDGTEVTFERCLIATGAEPRRPAIPGIERGWTLRTLDDARRIRDAARPGARAVIIGGGFIGVEVASSLASRGVHVTVIELADSLWGGALGPELAAWALDRLERTAIRVLTHATTREVRRDAVIVDDAQIPADLVLVAVGVTPRDELARDAALHVDDGVVTDAEQRTSAPGIWAAGDVARVAGRRIEHWHAAREGGERAALSMLGRPVPSPRAPWVFSEAAGAPFDVVGDARGWDSAQWVKDEAVLAYVAGGVVVQVAIIGSALDPEVARRVVEAGASVEELERLV